MESWVIAVIVCFSIFFICLICGAILSCAHPGYYGGGYGGGYSGYGGYGAGYGGGYGGGYCGQPGGVIVVGQPSYGQACATTPPPCAVINQRPSCV
uniref:Uncharacterized protein n=1 Tax=Panagrolaimus superbus TaxID=310955 RepID=A0A914ZA35_9BILA